MKVTVKYNVPIGNHKAIERRETFHAISSWTVPGTSLMYFKTDRFNVRSEAKENIVSIK